MSARRYDDEPKVNFPPGKDKYDVPYWQCKARVRGQDDDCNTVNDITNVSCTYGWCQKERVVDSLALDTNKKPIGKFTSAYVVSYD
jgi:hypothetical protein